MTTTTTAIIYGISCERTTARTAILRALVLAVHAHRATKEATADGSAWDLANLGPAVETAAAVDALTRAASNVLPPGQVGGELLRQARAGKVAGLDVTL